MQMELPVASWYCPAAHATQNDDAVAPVVVEPSLYCPAAQLVQAFPDAQDCPALQSGLHFASAWAARHVRTTATSFHTFGRPHPRLVQPRSRRARATKVVGSCGTRAACAFIPVDAKDLTLGFETRTCIHRLYEPAMA